MMEINKIEEIDIAIISKSVSRKMKLEKEFIPEHKNSHLFESIVLI